MEQQSNIRNLQDIVRAYKNLLIILLMSAYTNLSPALEKTTQDPYKSIEDRYNWCLSPEGQELCPSLMKSRIEEVLLNAKKEENKISMNDYCSNLDRVLTEQLQFLDTSSTALLLEKININLKQVKLKKLCNSNTH